MTSFFLSAPAARTLALSDDGLPTMFDLDTGAQFHPRAYEIEAFFASAPEEVAGEDLRGRLDHFQDEIRVDRAMRYALSALDGELRKETRLSAIRLLNEAALVPGTAGEVVRALLDRAAEVEIGGATLALTLAQASAAAAAEALLLELREKVPVASGMHEDLSASLLASLGEPARTVVADRVRSSGVLGLWLTGALGEPRAKARLDEACVRIVEGLPEELDPRKVAGALSTGLRQAATRLAVRQEPELKGHLMKRSWFPLGGARNAVDAAESTDAAEAPRFRGTVAAFAKALFEAGSLNDDTQRWEYLLDVSLIADPGDLIVWTAKTSARVTAGDFSGAALVEAALGGHQETRHWGTLASRGLGSFNEAREPVSKLPLYWHSPTTIRRTTEHAETTSPVDPLLVQLCQLFSAPAQSSHQVDALFRIVRPRTQTSSRLSSVVALEFKTPGEQPHGLSFNLGRIYKPSPEPEDLLRCMIEFAEARSDLGDGPNPSSLGVSSIIDAFVRLSDNEVTHMMRQLELSDFYRRYWLAIDSLQGRVPALGILLLGKLASERSAGGGFAPGASESSSAY